MRIFGFAAPEAADYWVFNCVFALCWIRPSASFDERMLGMSPFVGAVALSPDGQWVALARPYDNEGRTRVQIQRLGSTLVAQAWIQGNVSRLLVRPEISDANR